MLAGKNILLGITGGIAAYKTASLVRLFKKNGANVKVILTPAAKEFVTPLTLATLSENPVNSSFFNEITGEWTNHVDLGLWADLFVIAPATANTIAKMANGISDNLLLATYLSCKSKVYIAPAMDLDMYIHPSTTKNLMTLKSYGNVIIDAKEGELASGLVGKGRMEEPEQIVEDIKKNFRKDKSLFGKRVLITAGPTFEKIDPVRFIGNNSSGKMGLFLAEEALELGAEVTLVIGPNNLDINPLINSIKIESAQQMYHAVHNNIDDANIIIMSAAVADYSPKNVSDIKIKKKTDSLTIELAPTKDILKSVGEIKKQNQLLVGFALETNDEKENAIKKLNSKNLDMIILNSLNDIGAGFGHNTNKVTIIDKNNNVEDFELKSKALVASDIFNKIISLLKQ
ncbi:bifunctional phosphopantothenoylcysteine decarboxylase/phosphopantothenate--cysteine ligase CoaBC [Vicingus serpentipes]|uniref:Coenzyme A biosynthesis bifunctional protein CoaBC n=1 Tax=Vicingus serpentipes TaxID=1926625 RepID=A0A5C6RU39_9FLAO|nr:bifunctional phosphopantothenoylcysteine decarboxylase/phosphopantothenate--cysteine ligase CoaBC [Vicingus serpentipes]TXB65821.1 bifunctional phosphopantothenoylcysteine decarboxylase/phosphopantothenate--cysteine ligase CoaBC [Vicingus serpentipes]